MESYLKTVKCKRFKYLFFDDLKNALFVDTKNINIDLSNFKLNGNDFTLEKVALAKPTVTLNDKKNKLNIINKDIELTVNNLSSKDSILNLIDTNLKLSAIDLKDNKNSLTLFLEKFEFKT